MMARRFRADRPPSAAGASSRRVIRGPVLVTVIIRLGISDLLDGPENIVLDCTGLGLVLYSLVLNGDSDGSGRRRPMTAITNVQDTLNRPGLRDCPANG